MKNKFQKHKEKKNDYTHAQEKEAFAKLCVYIIILYYLPSAFSQFFSVSTAKSREDETGSRCELTLDPTCGNTRVCALKTSLVPRLFFF